MTKETIICGTLDELTAYFAAEFPVASLHPAEGFPTYTEQLQRIVETDVKTGAVFLLKSDLDLAKAAQSESPPEVTVTLVKTWVHIRWPGEAEVRS